MDAREPPRAPGAGPARPRVLVVDDSIVFRRFVAAALEGAPDLELAGVAATGRIALERLAAGRVDLVTLDLDMPGLDGLETLAAIRARHPGVRVVMLSALTERGAVATLDALAAGASDWVTKPAGARGPDDALRRLAEELVPKLRLLGGVARAAPASAPVRRPEAPPGEAPEGGGPPDGPAAAIIIGASTGGPTVVDALIRALPPDLDAPVLVVQHMPALFTAQLARRLDGRARVPVAEAVDGAPVGSGRVWIAPGGQHLAVKAAADGPRLRLTEGPPEHGCRPAVDVLLRAAAEVWGAGALAVICTGMGRDGLAGCAALRARGGRVLVQDEASSVVWGMPGVVWRAGLAEAALPPEGLAAAVATRARLAAARR